MQKASPWDDLFGANSSSSMTSGFDDKFDTFGANGHVAVERAPSPWSANATTSDDLFGTSQFEGTEIGGAQSGGGGSRARPRPSNATKTTNPANPFSVALSAVTANRWVSNLNTHLLSVILQL